MQEIGYRSWALIAVDDDPATSEATVTVPPVITNVAIERGASLVFELSESFAKLSITLRTTALSAKGRDDLCRVFAGSSASDLHELAVEGVWKKTIDGLVAVFEGEVAGNGIDLHVKLHFDTGPKLIVTAATFSA